MTWGDGSRSRVGRRSNPGVGQVEQSEACREHTIRTARCGTNRRTGLPVERLAASRFGNPFAWTGQRYDGGVKLYHFLHRSYSPRLGRWLQRDPLGYVDGVSLYEYVASQPTGSTDALGLCSKFLPDFRDPNRLWAELNRLDVLHAWFKQLQRVQPHFSLIWAMHIANIQAVRLAYQQWLLELALAAR